MRFDDDDAFFLHVGLLLVFVFLDQLLKQFTIRILDWGESIPVGFFSITYVGNRGASFGILQQYGFALTVVAAVAFIVCCFLYVKMPTDRFAIMVVAAGIAGNLIDRLLYGYVVDMIDFGWFPVFNLADTMIFFGILALIFSSWKCEWCKRKCAEQTNKETKQVEKETMRTQPTSKSGQS